MLHDDLEKRNGEVSRVFHQNLISLSIWLLWYTTCNNRFLLLPRNNTLYALLEIQMFHRQVDTSHRQDHQCDLVCNLLSCWPTDILSLVAAFWCNQNLSSWGASTKDVKLSIYGGRACSECFCVFCHFEFNFVCR